MSVELIVDMSNPRERQLVLSKMRDLQGCWRIEMVKYRRRRTDRQNRYYWPCFVEPFSDFLKAQGESVSSLYAHEILKHKFLRKTAVNRETGEAIGEYTRSTTELSTSEFNEYLDQCAAWLLEMFGIQVPEPEVYRLRDEPEDAQLIGESVADLR